MSQLASTRTIETARTDTEITAARTRHAASSTFADTLAHYATPLFPQWTPSAPIHNDKIPGTSSTLSARAADQRRDRRQRSRG